MIMINEFSRLGPQHLQNISTKGVPYENDSCDKRIMEKKGYVEVYNFRRIFFSSEFCSILTKL